MAFNLFGKSKEKEQPTGVQVQDIALDQIVPNRFQPRKVFTDSAIEELAETIHEHGLLQPIVLREYAQDRYEIIAGERRFRAMQHLHMDKAPAIVQKMSDEESAAMALIENLQRVGSLLTTRRTGWPRHSARKSRPKKRPRQNRH